MSNFRYRLSKRIGIVGSRKYQHVGLLFIHLGPIADLVRELKREDPNITVVSGGASNVDNIAVRAAKFYGMKTDELLADWDRYGRGAGMVRNAWLASSCDEVHAFWDGYSPGTRNTLSQCKQRNVPYIIHEEN